MRLFAFVLFFLQAVCLLAQQPPLTLRQAVELAAKSYPSVRISEEQLGAATAGIRLARTGYLPRADVIGQWNRATRNNVFGMTLPQAVLPGISGPVLPDTSLTSVWGSAVGVLVSWEPFDFGLRRANVDSAEASKRRAQAAVERTRFEVSAAAADAFLTELAAEQTVRGAQAAVDRSKVLLTVVDALVKAELRPGVDGSRSRSELAVAETQLIQAQQAVQVAKATLSQLLGTPASGIAPDAGPLLTLPQQTATDGGVDNHPAAREQLLAVEEVKAREKTLDKTWYPKFMVQGANYARGTGANPNGATEGGVNGLGPNIFNYGLGMTVMFPLFDLPSLRAKREAETYRERAESARLDLVKRDLSAQHERALAYLEGARKVAANTPRQLEFAAAAEQQALARYRAGLGTLVEVADTQRLRTQSEIDDSIARLNVWHAMLSVAVAEGDIEPFLRQGSR
ncbi:MAG: TolC family protein [Bryobacteraceae bacterium]